VLLEPGPEVTAISGLDLMNEDKASELVSAAFLDTGQQLQSPLLARPLSMLATPRPSTTRRS
jgi:hypothetical protein